MANDNHKLLVTQPIVQITETSESSECVTKDLKPYRVPETVHLESKRFVVYLKWCRRSQVVYTH